MERRRLLNINGIPFWEDCVFYAPLNQGDLADMISGNSCQKASFATLASIVYDSNVGAYLFTSGNYSSQYKDIFYWGNLNLGIFSNNMNLSDVAYTMVSKVRVATANAIGTSRHIPGLWLAGGYNYYIYSPNVAAGAYFNDDTIDNQWHEYIVRVGGGTTETIKDKTLQRTYAFSIVKNNYNYSESNKWVAVYINYASTNQQMGSAYIKDIRVYNRALTDAEIAQL